MDLEDLLLLDGANGNRNDPLATVGFDQRLGVGTIGLGTPTIGSDVLCRQQANLVAVTGDRSSPMVSRAARLEHEQSRLAPGDESGEAGTGESLVLE